MINYIFLIHPIVLNTNGKSINQRYTSRRRPDQPGRRKLGVLQVQPEPQPLVGLSLHCQQQQQPQQQQATQWLEFERRPNTAGAATLLHKLVIPNKARPNQIHGQDKVESAMQVLHILDKHSLIPSEHIYCLLLRVCTNSKAISAGKHVHAHLLKTLEQRKRKTPSNRELGHLLNLYSACGSVDDARGVLESISKPTPHDHTVFMALCIRHGLLDEARAIFDAMPQPNIVDWTSMIAAYTQNDRSGRALQMFELMMQRGVQPNDVTYIVVLTACANMKALQLGRQVHRHIVAISNGQHQLSAKLANVLLNFYGKCGALDDARAIFDAMPQRTVVDWTAMIAAYTQNDRNEEALQMFELMKQHGVQPNDITYNVVLTVCANMKSLQFGRQVHAQITGANRQRNLPSELATSLINFYGKCGELGDARAIFDRTSRPSVITWSTLMHAYSQNGSNEEAIRTFEQMTQQGIEPDDITYIVVLTACANMKALEYGQQVHERIVSANKDRPDLSADLATALINFYGRCGELDDARTIFDAIPQRGIITWNAMLTVYGLNGKGNKAMALLNELTQHGMQADDITLLSALNACSHAGLVKEGKELFAAMDLKYNISPSVRHYGALVDLLARAGQLDEAEETIKSMPIPPDHVVWMALLGGCRIHNDAERAKRAASRLKDIAPCDASVYVLLGNTYSASGNNAAAQRTWDERKHQGLKVTPGVSSIFIGSKQHIFLPKDTTHPQSGEIYEKLDWLCAKLKQAGYKFDTHWELKPASEEDKESALCRHSEKLALAFGLISTPEGTTLRITKNLRMCGDCHEATKRISGLVQRRIVVGDANRLHYFQNGSCSCGDYY